MQISCDFISCFKPERWNSTRPGPVISSESPGSTDVINTGFFTALPSLVIALLRAWVRLPRPQCSPVNITWQSEIFWKTSSGPLFIRPHWYLSEDNFTVSLLRNAPEESQASSYRASAKYHFIRESAVPTQNERTPQSVINHHFVSLVPCSCHMSGGLGY